MAKDYFCKDCQHNNNGWCNLHKKQGLKNIAYCADKHNNEKMKSAKNTKIADKQFGKREMFHNIQKQMVAIENDKTVVDKFTVLKQVMVNLEKVLSIEEQIHGISLDYELDEDILESSKKISDRWLETVGEYKGE